MDIQEYINSGIIEDYCLGVLDDEAMQQVAAIATLHPAIQEKIDAYESTLKNYAGKTATPPALKHKLLAIIDNLAAEETITADNIPLINKYSNADNWLQFVKPLLPATLNGPFIIHDLPATLNAERFIFWTNEDLPDETHRHVKESILVLQGSCRCYIGDTVYELTSGDFLSIPLHIPHNVEILNGPVMAVIQRERVA